MQRLIDNAMNSEFSSLLEQLVDYSKTLVEDPHLDMFMNEDLVMYGTELIEFGHNNNYYNYNVNDDDDNELIKFEN